MRVVFNTSFENGTRAVATATEALAEAQRQLSSGRRIDAPSDDPLAAAGAITAHGTLDRLDAYQGATSAATYRLNLADSVLTDIVAQLSSAQTTALSARGSSASQKVRDAAAGELLAIRDAIAADANTQFQGGYLFSGSRATTAPYSVTGGVFSAYQGDSSTTTIEIAPGRSVASTFDGGALFQGSDAKHVLDALTDLASALTAGDQAAVSTGVDALERAFDRATTMQSRIGQDLRTADDVRLQLSENRTDSVARLSSLEDANLVDAAANLSKADTAYRAALSAMASIGRLSLMDYLK